MSRLRRHALITVRPRHPGDDRFIADLSGESFASYARRPQGVVRAMLARPGSATLVADDGGRLFGFCVVAFHNHRCDYGPIRRPVLAQLDAIAVYPSARGRGVGRTLLARAEAVALQRGALSMSLTTASGNVAARALFARAGYQNTAQLAQVYRKRELAVWMSKILD
jgi:ribosomal protein S18 acetylase RimI-like enzyme